MLILLWSVYSFFSNIESSFNTIWQVRRSRSRLRQFTIYVTVLLLVPVLMVVSSGLSIFFSSATADLNEWAVGQSLRLFTVRFLPFLTCWLIFSWLYWAIPNTKVGAWAAFIPGVLVGTLFQLLQMLSFYLVAFLSRTSIVYGAFAVVPLLMTWLQLSCLFMLSGAELSFAIENNEDFEYERDLRHISRRYKDYVTLYLTWLVVRRFSQGASPQSAVEMAHENRLPARLVNQLLGRLVEVGVLRETWEEGREDRMFVPAFDIHRMTVGEVVSRIDRQGTELFLQHPAEECERFWKRYSELRESRADLDRVLVMELL
jgi:membrane protein